MERSITRLRHSSCRNGALLPAGLFRPDPTILSAGDAGPDVFDLIDDLQSAGKHYSTAKTRMEVIGNSVEVTGRVLA